MRSPSPTLTRQKLVSHRLRGFGLYENSRTSLERACGSGVPYLEIDTRVAADGHIFVYHGPRAMAPLSSRPYFARTTSREVRQARYPSGEGLLEFDECVEIFSRTAHQEQRLCVDMKDFGFEQAHLETVERYGVEERVSWISWLPQSLMRLRALGASGPLILAHCNLTRFASLGRLIESACARRSIQLSYLVLFGAASGAVTPASLAHGYQHGLLVSRLPAVLERFLAGGGRGGGGGICVNRLLLSQRLVDYCRGAGLQLWVFRVRRVQDYQRYAALDGVTLVFSDDAPAVIEASGGC